ncbi:hypothetical protein FACS189459_4570 [Bacilli bacterium]|nr:hypothetical protein FACS189459_4570 [Bacilli bacterium]
MFILHYYSEIDSLIISKTKEDKMQNIIKLSTEFFILFTIISFFLIRYKIIQNKLPKSDTL